MYTAKELFKRTFIYVGEDMFEVFRILPEANVSDVNEMKEKLGVETAFRKEGNLFFVTKIEEPEYELIVTETTELVNNN